MNRKYLSVIFVGLAAFAYSNAQAKFSPRPSAEAIAACKGFKENDSCNFIQDNTKIAGTCQKTKDNVIACVGVDASSDNNK
jgi:hypothetical protein